MKGKFFILLLGTILVSCVNPRSAVLRGEGIATDSVTIQFGDLVLPSSRLELSPRSMAYCSGKYYCMFEEIEKPNDWVNTFLVSLSKKGREVSIERIPPHDLYFLTVRNDTLVATYNDKSFFCFDVGKKCWLPDNSGRETILYEDKSWVVRFSEHGEFGSAMWFIDKNTLREYAFAGLANDIYRIGNVFYLVCATRIFKIPDPAVGFLCDSTTCFENSKDVRFVSSHFYHAGYFLRKPKISPTVRFDPWDDSLEYISDPATDYSGENIDTLIVGSFVDADKLYCLLDAPNETIVSRLDGSGLSKIYGLGTRLPLRIWGRGFSGPGIIPLPGRPSSGGTLVRIPSVEGYDDILDIRKDGCTRLRIKYPHP